jgi:hypothetical protein
LVGEGAMAVLRLSIDSSLLRAGTLSPASLEVISGTLDLLYFTCLREEGGFPSPIVLSDYSAQIDHITYSNPLDIWATLKNVSGNTVRAILDRTLFYKLERERRALENLKLQQEVIDLTLKNAERIARTRRKLIQSGVSQTATDRLLGRLIADQSLSGG